MKKFDLENWHRKDVFDVFIKFAFPHFSLSAEVNVTRLVAFAKEHKLSFYRLMLYAVCRAGNGVEAFRLRIRPDNTLVEHEAIGVAPAFGTGGGRYNFCCSPYRESPKEFIRLYDEQEEVSRAMGRLNLENDVNDDTIYISSLPWLRVTGPVVNPLPDARDSIPRVVWGKYSGPSGNLSLSVSLQMHHAVADGYDAYLFYSALQELIDSPEKTFAELA